MSSRAEAWASEELERLSRLGLRRTLEPLESAQGPRIQVGGQWLVNFSSNDYLGLAGDPRLAEAAAKALSEIGTGAGASRLIVGDTTLHHALEKRLAQFLGTPAAVLFNSGYAANVGIIQALCGREDVVFSDELNHASLIDGCRLSRAKTVIYPHNDIAKLDELLAASQGRRKLVCSDAVFSMDGDRARLRELVEVCEKHGAALLLDEAHALGVIGPRGQGLSAELGLADRVDIRMGTLGKAFGSFGAFAATSQAVAELLVNRARSLVFSTALPGALCAASIAGVNIAEADELRRANLWRLIDQLSSGLRSLGVAAVPASAIFSVVLGTPEAAVEAGRRLRSQGLLAKPIRPPTVPEGTSRLRLSLSATHTAAEVSRLLESLATLPELRRAA